MPIAIGKIMNKNEHFNCNLDFSPNQPTHQSTNQLTNQPTFKPVSQTKSAGGAIANAAK